MFGVIVQVVCHGRRSPALRRPPSPAHPGGTDTAHTEFVICDESIEQDHRGIKQRYRPMGGFKHGTTAACFCRLFDEVRAFLRPQSHHNQSLPLKQRRAIHQERFAQLMSLTATGSNHVIISVTLVEN
jgi:putative transposase